MRRGEGGKEGRGEHPTSNIQHRIPNIQAAMVCRGGFVGSGV